MGPPASSWVGGREPAGGCVRGGASPSPLPSLRPPVSTAPRVLAVGPRTSQLTSPGLSLLICDGEVVMPASQGEAREMLGSGRWTQGCAGQARVTSEGCEPMASPPRTCPAISTGTHQAARKPGFWGATS